MFGSLRFRLPAFFLLGILLAGLIASLISIRFFQSYTRARAIDELRSESVGIVQLYAQQAGRESVPPSRLVHALGGDRIFWVPNFRCVTLLQGIPDLPASTVNMKALRTRARRRRSISIGRKRTARTTLRWPSRSPSGQPLRRARRRQADIAAS